MSALRIAVLGDSLAAGYPTASMSWIPVLESLYPAQYLNCAVAGARICDMPGQLPQEKQDLLLLPASVNDCWKASSAGAPDLSMRLRLEYWRRLHEAAGRFADKILVFGALPVNETLLPCQSWSDKPVYASNEEIATYNRMVRLVAEEYQRPFFDPYPLFVAEELAAVYSDACHLRPQGRDKYARFVFETFKNIILF